MQPPIAQARQRGGCTHHHRGGLSHGRPHQLRVDRLIGELLKVVIVPPGRSS
jgi:hypothetical protein